MNEKENHSLIVRPVGAVKEAAPGSHVSQVFVHHRTSQEMEMGVCRVSGCCMPSRFGVQYESSLHRFPEFDPCRIGALGPALLFSKEKQRTKCSFVKRAPLSAHRT
jgi:hypothetical protein